MHQLIYRITSDSLWELLQGLPFSQSRYMRYQFVISNPMVFNAFERHFQDDAQKLRTVSVAIPISTASGVDIPTADVLLVNSLLEEAPLHVPIFCPDDAILVRSVAQSIAATLDWMGATQFLDVFARSSVVLLRQLLQEGGIQEFLRGIMLMVQIGGEEGQYDKACLLLRERITQKTQANGVDSKAALGNNAVKFLDHISAHDNPHLLLKALLSYHVFLKSNRNITKASDALAISRTTLHNHLRLADDLQLFVRFPLSPGMKN